MQYFDYSATPGKTIKREYDIKGIKPLVSIITPFFNAGKYFKECFNSVLNQSFPYFEWIIVDDDSTNEKDVEILHEFAQKDSRIKVYTLENELRRQTGKSYGASAARNYGAGMANTQLLLFLDADDMLDPVFIETTYLVLALEKEAAWAYTDIVTFGDKELLWRREFSSDLMKTENLLAVTTLVRKEMFDALGGFEIMHGKYFNEDWHFWLRALAKNYKPAHVAQYLLWYRNTEGALKVIKDNDEIAKENARIIGEAAQDVPNGIKAIEYIGSVKEKSFTGLKLWNDYSEIPQNKMPFSTEKQRILCLFPHLHMGGSDKFNFDLISRLDEEKFDVSIITTLPEDNEWQHLFVPFVQDVFALPFLFDMKDWTAFIDYIIKTRGISLIFCSNSYFGYFALPYIRALYPHIAIVDYVHMEEWYYRGGGYARTTGNIGAVLDKTYVCNNGTKNIIEHDFKRQNNTLSTVYVGVDEEKFCVDNADINDVFKVLPNLPKDKKAVLFPCRIVAQKRPFLMLEIAKKMPQFSFIVVGDGEQENELVNAAKAVKNIYFSGRQDDLRPFYKFASVTLICSLREGLSLTAYESLAMATPVVTSDVGGQKELVDCTTGIVVPIDYTKTLQEDNRDFFEETELYVKAILQILSDDDKYIKLCENCRKKIESGFTISQMAEQLSSEFNALTSEENCNIRKEKYKEYNKFLPLFESYAELFADLDYLERKFFFSDGSYKYYKEYCDTKGRPAYEELERLKQTRSFKLANVYQNTVNNSAFLRKLRQVLSKLKPRN